VVGRALIALLLPVVLQTHAAQLRSRVVTIADGDTIGTKMGIPILGEIEKLINEHGSAVILKEAHLQIDVSKTGELTLRGKDKQPHE
jgi:hypothetical protein